MSYTTLKNTVLTGAVSLLAFNASSANAAGYYDYGSSYDYCDPCPQVACPCPCDSNFYVGAEALIWKVNNKDQNFGAVSATVENDVTVTTIGLQSADHNWNLGFRIFGGYKVDDCCDWELYLAYTNLNSRASSSFLSELDIGDIEELSAEVNFRNRLKYQTFDALVAKEFAVNQCGYIRPFFGFRGLWLDQNPEVSVQLTDDENDLLVVANSLDSCVNAYGLHGGTEYYWTICDGFGVYGTIGASVLHADINNVHTLAVLADDDGDVIVDTLVTVNDNQCAPLFGYLLGAGVRYETDYCACGTNMLVRLDLGYEFNHWLCTPQLLDGGSLEEAFDVEVLGVERSNGGSLLLQGVRIGLGLYF